MDTQSLALDLVGLDLADRDALVRLLADHVVAPARRAWGLPLPERGEHPADVLGSTVSLGRTVAWFGPTPGLTVSTALFDDLIRGFIVFTRLLPAALVGPDREEARLEAPNWVYFEESRQLAAFLYDDLERLVDGLLGQPPVAGERPELERRYDVSPNGPGMAELFEAQELARRCLATPTRSEPPLYARHDVGVRALGQAAAFALDEVLRADVHQRAVWLADVDLLFPLTVSVRDAHGVLATRPVNEDAILERVDDHGVYPTVIPETIRGAVALDLVSTFSRQRSVGVCAHCSRPIVLTPHQVGRVDHGLPVYHGACNPAHRRRWMRDYQRSRRAAGQHDPR